MEIILFGVDFKMFLSRINLIIIHGKLIKHVLLYFHNISFKYKLTFKMIYIFKP